MAYSRQKWYTQSKGGRADMAHAHVRPARHTNYSTELMTNVRGVHGYEFYCACGDVGLTWKTHAEARAEGRWHFYEKHGREIGERRQAGE